MVSAVAIPIFTTVAVAIPAWRSVRIVPCFAVAPRIAWSSRDGPGAGTANAGVSDRTGRSRCGGRAGRRGGRGCACGSGAEFSRDCRSERDGAPRSRDSGQIERLALGWRRRIGRCRERPVPGGQGAGSPMPLSTETVRPGIRLRHVPPSLQTLTAPSCSTTSATRFRTRTSNAVPLTAIVALGVRT